MAAESPCPAAAPEFDEFTDAGAPGGITLDAELHGLFAVAGARPQDATLRAERRMPSGVPEARSHRGAVIETTTEFTVGPDGRGRW